MRTLLLSVLLLLAAAPAEAQWRDAFEDGDVTDDPPWAGTPGAWRVASFADRQAVYTAGRAAADTLVLATDSPSAHGRWTLTVAYRDVNLSNFNGVRVYLVADRPALDGPVDGYFLQLGASNADELRLYRQDGTTRQLLARSPPVFTAPTDTVHLAATRTREGRWTVAADGDTLLTALDAVHARSRVFGLWVKHTATTADAYAFSDVVVEAAPPPADTTAPRLLGARLVEERRVQAAFSEPALGCTASAYTLTSLGAPAAVTGCTPGVADTTFTLVFPRPVPALAEHTLTARGVADPAGNVREETSASFFAGTLAVPMPGTVVVNEVMYAPPAGVPEYVELFNRSDAWLDLGTLRLTDTAGPPAVLAPAGTPLAPGTFAVVTADADALADAFPDAPPARTLTEWPSLNNGGDALVLLTDETVVDRMQYAGGAGEGALERVDPDAPSERFNWAVSSASRGGTPGTRNARYALDDEPPGLTFAEEVADAAVEATFSEPLDGASVAPTAFSLGGLIPTTVVAAGPATWRLRFAPSPEALSGDVLSVSGVRDRTGNVLAAGAAPLVRRPRSGEVVVNEILADPLADPHDGRPDQPEYVELFNRAPHPVSLRGAFWTGPVDERGAADTLRLPEGRHALPPGGYAVVFAAGTHPARTELAAAFPDADLDRADVLLLPLPRSSLRLAAAGDLIHLHRADGTSIERLAYESAWHRPDLLDATGTALERVAPEAPTGEAESWASAVHPDGGTPGGPNSLHLPPAAEGGLGLQITPSPFSPDADGHDDLATLTYRLQTAEALLRVRIFDAHGRLVRTLAPAALAAREGRLAWDGFDDAGHSLPIGIYVVHLEAVDARGGTVEEYAAAVVLARRLE